MARERRDVWEKRVERWRESGLTAQEYAAEIGVESFLIDGGSGTPPDHPDRQQGA
jgi:hypothetical protein